MDIIKWIDKNNFKGVDDNLAIELEKLSSLNEEKQKLTNKIESYKNNLKSLKEALEIIQKEIDKTNNSALKSLKVLPIISIGFDARSSTYICIVKYKKATKSFYLGNESKIRKQLQQFYNYDLKAKNLEFIKDQVKMIVSNVVSEFINTRSKYIFTDNPKLNFKNVLDRYYESNLWEYWRQT
tara:strand:+ start:92 stop:637 length:546 start_codon:yes stop_codon:yes gene_type:complete